MVQQIYLQIVTHKCTSLKVRGNSVTFHLSLLKLHPLGEFRFVWWEKVVIDPECDQSILRNPCAREKRFGKKRKIRMIEVCSY